MGRVGPSSAPSLRSFTSCAPTAAEYFAPFDGKTPTPLARVVIAPIGCHVSVQPLVLGHTVPWNPLAPPDRAALRASAKP